MSDPNTCRAVVDLGPQWLVLNLRDYQPCGAPLVRDTKGPCAARFTAWSPAFGKAVEYRCWRTPDDHDSPPHPYLGPWVCSVDPAHVQDGQG